MKAQLNQSIEIKLNPSPLLLGLLTSIAIVSALSLVILPIPFWVKLLLIALVVFSTLYFILRDCLLLLPWSWRYLEVNHVGELKLTNQQGQQFSPVVLANSLVHPKLLILNLEQTSPKNNLFASLPGLLLFATTDNEAQHRQLRVWLRWWRYSSGQPI